MNLLNFVDLPFGKAFQGSKNAIKGFKGVPKQLPGSPNLSINNDIVTKLRNELSKEGIISQQKTLNLPWKEPIRKTIQPWNYELKEKIADIKTLFKDSKNPDYINMDEAYEQYVIFQKNNGAQNFLNKEEYTKTLKKTLHKTRLMESQRDVINHRFNNRFAKKNVVEHSNPTGGVRRVGEKDVNANVDLVKNRWATWDMYLGKPQTQHPMYDISELTKSKKDVIYTIKEDFIKKDEVQYALKDYLDDIESLENGQETFNQAVRRVAQNITKKGDSWIVPDTDVGFFGTMGGFHWKIEKMPDGNYKAIANDVWDLQPLKNQKIGKYNTLSGKILDKVIKPIKNIEVGKALGIGKPLNVKVGFILDGKTKKIINTFGLAPVIGTGVALGATQYKQGGISKFDDGGTIYNVKGSKGNYKKINGKWQVDWNRSGKYQPLSKDDVKARTAVLDKMAKPVYTPSPKIDPYAKINSNSSDNTNLNLYQKEIPWELSTKYKGDILAQNKKNKEDAINYRAKNTISNEDFKKENHISTEFPKNATASDYGQRIWEYATNPGTALEYAFGKKSGQGPMPFNINQLKEQGVNVNSDSNLVGNMFNMINPLDDIESVRSGVSDIVGGNNSGYLNAGLGVLGFLPGGDALKGFKKYGKDLVQTSKQAGKFQFPKYKTVYRAEHAGYNQAAKEGSVDGRWVANTPEEVKFYVDKLKDPATGHVLPYSFGDQPVRIIQQRLPEYEIKNTFGAGMPEEAKIMSMGRGEFTDTGLDDLLGFGTGSRFSKGRFNQHDINAMSTAPFLYNKNEGILDADLINKLRNQKSSNFFSSGKNNIFNNQKDALDYLTSEQKLMNNNSMFKKYLPFKQGGATNDYVELDLTPEKIQKYIDGGYIVEEIN